MTCFMFWVLVLVVWNSQSWMQLSHGAVPARQAAEWIAVTSTRQRGTEICFVCANRSGPVESDTEWPPRKFFGTWFFGSLRWFAPRGNRAFAANPEIILDSRLQAAASSCKQLQAVSWNPGVVLMWQAVSLTPSVANLLTKEMSKSKALNSEINSRDGSHETDDGSWRHRTTRAEKEHQHRVA